MFPLAACRGRAVPAIPTVLDLFSGVDGTSLDAHTMNKGSGWTFLDGTLDINTNTARITAVGVSGGAYAVTDIGKTDYTLFAAVTPAGSPAVAGLLVRVDDIDNLWLIRLGTDAQKLQIYRRIAGVYSIQAEVAATIIAGTTYHLSVNVVTSQTGHFVTAILTDQGVSATCQMGVGLTATKAGLVGITVGDRFDNFMVP